MGYLNYSLGYQNIQSGYIIHKQNQNKIKQNIKKQIHFQPKRFSEQCNETRSNLSKAVNKLIKLISQNAGKLMVTCPDNSTKVVLHRWKKDMMEFLTKLLISIKSDTSFERLKQLEDELRLRLECPAILDAFKEGERVVMTRNGQHLLETCSRECSGKSSFFQKRLESYVPNNFFIETLKLLKHVHKQLGVLINMYSPSPADHSCVPEGLKAFD